MDADVERNHHVAGHRVEALAEGRSRLTLSLDMRGVLIPIVALFYRKLTNQYMALEAEGMKRAAESGLGTPMAGAVPRESR